MATKIKRIYKKFKFITQIFVAKKRQMEIGHPTDVKHVAHIGLNGLSGTATICVNEFKKGPDFKTTSTRNSRGSNPTPISTWSSQDFEWDANLQQSTITDLPSSDLPNIPKKQKPGKK